MIHYFNPGHETAVLNGSPYYMAPSNVSKMQQEMAFLPAWYASADDFVFVNNDFNITYFDYLVDNLGYFTAPVREIDLPSHINERICLWGISPQAIHFWEELQSKTQTEFVLPEWHDEYFWLNSRMAAKDCLSDLVSCVKDISKSIIPEFCSSLSDIEKAIKNYQVQILAKAPYSSSGRGLLWLPQTGLTQTERQILHGILKKQELVSLERVLDKQTDFAMEFVADGKGNVEFVGCSLFATNKKGAYEGNFLWSQIAIKEYLLQQIPVVLFDNVKEQLKEILSHRYASIYSGCIGVDMMIYKEEGIYKLHPCVEINLRYNMGYLSLCFSERFLHPLSIGNFNLDFSPKEGYIFEQHQHMQNQYPAVFENKKLKSGYLSLCPVSGNNHYWAYVIVTDNGGEILRKQ